MWNSYFAYLAPIVMLLGLTLLVSCKAVDAFLDPTPLITDTRDANRVIAKEMGDIADNIDEHVDAVEQVLPANVKPVAAPKLDDIRDDAAELRGLQIRLDAKTDQLDIALEQVDTVTDMLTTTIEKNETQQEEIQQLRQEKNSLRNSLLSWLVFGSIVGCSLFIALWSSGKKWAKWLSLASVIVLNLALLVGEYMLVFAIGGGVLLLVVGLIFVWEFYARQKENRRLTEHLHEVTQVCEVAKAGLAPDKRVKIFGDGVSPGDADIIQTPSTRVLVKQIRSGPMFRKYTST